MSRCEGMRRMRIAILLTLAILGSVPLCAGASMVVNGSFETPYVDPAWVNYWSVGGTYGGWTVSHGSIDQVAAGDYSHTWNWQAADSVQSLDMSGLGSAGTMFQDVNTTSGEIYRLSFALAGNPYGTPSIRTLRVWWEGSIIGTYTFDIAGKTGNDMGWTYISVQVTGSGGASRLAFESLTDGYYGPALDDVTLEPLSSTGVPANLGVRSFALNSVAPNPSSRAIRIEYSVPRESTVRLSVVDIQGREIAMLAGGAHSPGSYRVSWDGRSVAGPVPAGVYFVRFVTPERSFVSRVVITH